MGDYMNPPPPPGIVIVHNDNGGDFYSYLHQTNRYSTSKQKVALIRCRSACTMALSLSNVCVFPNSTLGFHAAYYEDTKKIADKETQILLSLYPTKVRNRLGELGKDIKILSGKELIDMGIRSCI